MKSDLIIVWCAEEVRCDGCHDRHTLGAMHLWGDVSLCSNCNALENEKYERCLNSQPPDAPCSSSPPFLPVSPSPLLSSLSSCTGDSESEGAS